MYPPPEPTGQSGGVNISGSVASIRPDVVGRDKITNIYKGATAEEIVSQLVAVLDKRGATQKAENAGLERQAIVKIAQRLKPDVPDFDQAVRELEARRNGRSRCDREG